MYITCNKSMVMYKLSIFRLKNVYNFVFMTLFLYELNAEYKQIKFIIMALSGHI